MVRQAGILIDKADTGIHDITMADLEPLRAAVKAERKEFGEWRAANKKRLKEERDAEEARQAAASKLPATTKATR